MRSLLLTFLFSLAVPAVETGSVPVLSVYDGDTITVASDIGGEVMPLRVRMLYIDTPELRGNRHGEAIPEGKAAADSLKSFLPAGTMVRLWAPGERLTTDQYGRILAVIMIGEQSAQEHMIQAGWSPYWRKFGEAPEPWHSTLLTAEASAKTVEAGAWSSARQWMINKANERTAPKTSQAAPP